MKDWTCCGFFFSKVEWRDPEMAATPHIHSMASVAHFRLLSSTGGGMVKKMIPHTRNSGCKK